MADKTERPRLAYSFLRERARTKRPFSVEEFARATTWSVVSVKTYLGKMLKELVERNGNDLLARAEILTMSEDRFLAHMTQVRPVYTQYRRKKFEQLVTYEFLLPLTREDKLRRALDALFYSDTIAQRIREIGLATLENWVRRPDGYTDE